MTAAPSHLSSGSDEALQPFVSKLDWPLQNLADTDVIQCRVVTPDYETGGIDRAFFGLTVGDFRRLAAASSGVAQRQPEPLTLGWLEAFALEMKPFGYVKDNAAIDDFLKAVRARTTLALSSTPSKTPSWPDGCRDATSCARHKACMYMNCFYDGRSIAGDVERLTSEHSSTDLGSGK